MEPQILFNTLLGRDYICASRIYVPSVFLKVLSDQRPFMDGYDIEVVDNEIWQVKTGLLHAWNGLDREKEEVQQHASESFQEKVDNVASSQLEISCNAATRTAVGNTIQNFSINPCLLPFLQFSLTEEASLPLQWLFPYSLLFHLPFSSIPPNDFLSIHSTFIISRFQCRRS